jgi:hypothetical protein
MSSGIKLGWAFFGLLVVLLLGYALTRGLFMGSLVKFEARSSGGYFAYYCRYLYPDGVRLKYGGGTGSNPTEASENAFCPLLASER